MRGHRALLFVIAWVLPTATAFAAEKAEVEKILSSAREENQAMEHLDYLTNRIGSAPDQLGRAPDRLRMGPRPVQELRDRERPARDSGASSPSASTGAPGRAGWSSPRAKALTFGTNSWTAGTKGVVKGPAVLAPENDEQLAKVKDKLPGAWVLVPPAAAGPRGAAERAGGPAGAERRVPQEARRRLRRGEDRRASSAGTRNDLILTGGNYQVSWDKLPDRPTINLVKAQYDEIAGLIKEGKPVVLEFDIRNYFKKGPIPLYNVIADIPGTEFPDEYVIVGGHIDSWDGATGTDDNGTGCSTTLEAARLLMKSGIKPRRTIRFMLWSGEEQGLMGSRDYVKAHPELMKKISAVLVHDGGTNYLSGIGRDQGDEEGHRRGRLAPVIGLDAAMPFAIREVPGLRGRRQRPRLVPRRGRAGLLLEAGGQGELLAGSTTPSTTPMTRPSPEYQKHSSVVAALGALGIANLDHLLSREALIAPAAAAGRRRQPPELGVQLEELKVVEVVEGGTAEKAGFKAGDVIVKVGGKAIASREDFVAALQAAEATRRWSSSSATARRSSFR